MSNLDEVKQRDLVAYAEEQGYKRVEAKCSPHSVCLALGDDKIIVKVDGDGHCVYCNVHDDRDQGSIVDFVMKRQGCGYVEAMKTLLRLEHSSFPTGLKKPVSGLSKATEEPDRKKCLKVWASASWNPEPAYLVDRGLSAATLGDLRFFDTFRETNKGAIIFPHCDRSGMCGYEVRGHDIKSFGKGTAKGLWHTANLRTATAIVITESPIDALSHYELYFWDCAYAAIGGTLSRLQRDLVTGLLAKAKDRNALVIVATDNDEAGQGYFEQFKAMTTMKLKRHCPVGNDWNDDLQVIRSEA